MPRRIQADKPYLVAKPAGFPGLEIPLLSEEECRARGIEPAKWPPRETWTQEQRDAADRLADILRPHVFREALQVILAELDRMPADSELSEPEQEREAARRGIALIDAGKWKQRDTTIHFPRSWIREIVERFALGKLSLLDPEPPKRRRSAVKTRQNMKDRRP
jgi:hypothetical protein